MSHGAADFLYLHQKISKWFIFLYEAAELSLGWAFVEQ